ncbi:hypothetical protein Tco_1352317 [Tanacetum coccineum]
MASFLTSSTLVLSGLVLSFIVVSTSLAADPWWARKLGMKRVGVIRVRIDMGDKEVTKQDLVLKGGDRGACKLLGDAMVMLERWFYRCLSSKSCLQAKEGTLWVKASTEGMVDVDDIIIGSTNPRADIVHATFLCARYQAKPTKKHLKEVERIFRYLCGTVNMGLLYMKDFGFELTGFSDADYAGYKDTLKRTFGGTQFLIEKLVGWSSKKQDCMTLLTA